MATLKITERPQVPALKNGASLLITQQETVDGRPVEALRRIEANPLLAPPIIKTAQGEVVTISDSANRPFAGLRLYGKTTQDGTPTPDAPVPLVNVGAGGSIGAYARGKNLLNIDILSGNIDGITATQVGNGVKLSGTAASNGGFLVSGRRYIPAGTYTMSARMVGTSTRGTNFVIYFDNSTSRMVWQTGTMSNVYSTTFTLDVGTNIVSVQIVVDNGGVYDVTVSDMQIEVGTAATEYDTYKDGGSLTASTPNGLPGIPITSGGNYTDASGQKWACDVRDYGRGVDVHGVQKIVLNGSENITLDGDTFDVANAIQAGNTPYMPGLCSHYPVATDYDGFVSGDYGLCNWGNGALRIRDGGNTDVASFKARLAADPVTLYFPLPTTTETPIPADELAAYRAMSSQKPTTTVYNDAGAGMQVDYIADTELWSKASQASMIGAMELGMVASKNYAAGDFIVDQDAMTLYRATAPIAKGESIKPGTNCTATTVVEQLTALYSLINR